MTFRCDMPTPCHDEPLIAVVTRMRWVKAGQIYGFPAPWVYTVKPLDLTVTLRGASFHVEVVEHYRTIDTFNACAVTGIGPGKWDNRLHPIPMQLHELLRDYEPFKSRSERRSATATKEAMSVR